MRNNWRLRLKPIALLLTFTMLVSLGGCSRESDTTWSTNTAQSENTTDFQAYYEPLTSDDISIEGDVYYASSQILLTSVSDASYADIEKLIRDDGGEIIGYISTTGDYQLRFSEFETLEELEQVADDLKNNDLVEDASIAYVAQFSSDAIDYTNDPWIDAYDAEDTSGSVWDEDNPSGKNWWAEAIRMPTVWSMDLSTKTVKVGIIDGMFDTTNEDFTNKDSNENIFEKTWNNPTNEDGTCAVTQLYNDAVTAYHQATSDEEKKEAVESMSKYSHGTHVAGIIAAQANDSGIAGVNQNVKLYGYAVRSDEAAASDEYSWGSIFRWKCAIAHLLNEGVKVINISMGFSNALTGTQDGDSYYSTFTSVNSKALESFLLKYIEAGNEFLIVKSAGNESTADKKYDAGNDILGHISNSQVAQRIIIVGAAKCNSGYYSIADFSNTGSRVDVYAPGDNVLSDIPSNITTVKSGTSMSAPIVTGLVSLIWGINPDLSAEQVRSFIIASTGSTMFNFDDEADNPTAIVNADICVQLAQQTVGNGSTYDTEYGTVSGMVYALTSDGSDFMDIDIETLSLYNESGNLVETVSLQDFVYSGTILHTYSLLVEPGTYVLEADVEGYESQTQQIVVEANDVLKVDFELVPEDSSSTDIIYGQFDQSNVPSGAVEFNGHYYYAYNLDTVTTWEEAKQYCEEQSGYLATITSQEEDEFVYSCLRNTFNYESAYFGFTDQDEEGTWVWDNGEESSYTNWASGEPSNSYSNENFAMYYYDYTDGSWNDGNFGNGTVNDTTVFICEWGEYTVGSSSQLQEPVRTTSDERDIVLVLDVSGSMYGTPIEETKKASVNFIETILEEDASIGIVTYDSYAYRDSDFSVSKETLENVVSNIYSGGSTNMEAGIMEAESMLSSSNAKKKIIVLMSDGYPNYGKQGDELVEYANQVKDSGVIIYTLGFFSDLGSAKSSAQTLMEKIASDGCHYEVSSADDLVFFFEDMADQINGQKYIYVRIACPVDVSVTYDGQTLSSADSNLNLRTDFGTLTLEENEETETTDTDDYVKVLRLKEGTEYDIQIVGTGDGSMDYTIGFMDDDGNYSDLRRFEDIEITGETVIDTVAETSEESILNIDEDGDGRYDLRLSAGENGYGEEIEQNYTVSWDEEETEQDYFVYIIIIICGCAVLFVIASFVVMRMVRTKEKKR